MENNKACMVTGHRNLPAEKTEYIKEQLRREVLQAIGDGYTHFISGFAQGADLVFADIIVEFKKDHPITLEAAIPYRNRVNTKDPEFQRLLSMCDIAGVHSEEYSPGCFFKRNRIMVQLSNRVIAVYDGRGSGGTLATMRYAHTMEKEVRVIDI